MFSRFSVEKLSKQKIVLPRRNRSSTKLELTKPAAPAFKTILKKH